MALGGMIDGIQATRLKLLEAKIGLLPQGDLVKWADQQIQTLENPPPYLFDISLGVPPQEPIELNVEHIRITEAECSKLVSNIKENMIAEAIIFEEAAAYLYKLSLETSGRSSELLDWISDEVHLCESGVKALDGSMKDILEAIDEVIHSVDT